MFVNNLFLKTNPFKHVCKPNSGQFISSVLVGPPSNPLHHIHNEITFIEQEATSDARHQNYVDLFQPESRQK